MGLSKLSVEGSELVVVSAPIGTAVSVAGLTRAERAICDLVLEGLSVPEIASRRGRAERTITNQLGSIFGKLGVRSRLGLVARLGK